MFGTVRRAQSVGLAFTLPVDETLNVDVGIGGASSSPFSVPNAHDTLIAAGFEDSDLEGKGLDVLTPKESGIPFRNGNTVNAFISTDFQMGIFEVDVKGIVELAGEGDKMHQFNTRLKTTGKVLGVNLTTAIEIGLASQNEVIYREFATVTTVGINF